MAGRPRRSLQAVEVPSRRHNLRPLRHRAIAVASTSPFVPPLLPVPSRKSKAVRVKKNIKVEEQYVDVEEINDYFEPCSYRAPNTPFEVPPVMNEILAYLPLKDWKNCRLVCSGWQTACSLKYANFSLNIKDKKRLTALAIKKTIWGYNMTPAIYRDVKLPIDVPLGSDALNNFLKTYGSFIRCLGISNGWTLLGLQDVLFRKCHNIEELEITGAIPTSTADLMDGIEDVENAKLPNLKKLVLCFTNVYEDEASNLTAGSLANSNAWSKRLISSLLSITPNLKCIQCPHKRDITRDRTLCLRYAAQHRCSVVDIDVSFNKVNQYLAQKLFSSTHFGNPQLAELNLYLRLNNRGMMKLREKRYPLTSVDLHVRREDKHGLINLLITLGPTLQHMRLSLDFKLKIDFACNFLKHLKSLHLDDYAGDLNFIGSIPTLKKLTLSFFNACTLIRTYPTQCFSNSQLRSVKIEKLQSYDKQQSKLLKRMSVLFPNISEIQIDNATDRDLLKIYDCFPQLEHLYLESKTVSSIGVCGFTNAETDNILDGGYELDNFEEYESRRCLPYIGNLNHLKSLTLCGDVGVMSDPRIVCTTITVSTLWILHGLCNLPELRQLTIHNAMISSLEIKRLFQTLNLVRLELVDCQMDLVVFEWVQKQLINRGIEFIQRKNE